MSNWRDSASFCNSIPKNKESHTWLINMVIKFGARAVLLLLFQLAAPNSPASEVFSTCPLHQNKKKSFRRFPNGSTRPLFCLRGVGGGVAGANGAPTRGGGMGGGASNQSLFLPRTLAEQETSDLSPLCFSRCRSPAGK